MSEFKGTLPEGAELTVNGMRVRLGEKADFTALGVTSYDQAAERSALGGFPADWAHYETEETEDGPRTLLVQYGPQGNRIETEIQLDEGEKVCEDIPIAMQIPEGFVETEAPQIIDFTEDTLEVIEPGETEPTTFVEAEVVEAPKPKGKKAK